MLWIVINLRFCERIELGIEHPNNLAGFVVDDRIRLLVPQYRKRYSSSVGRVCFDVDLPPGSALKPLDPSAVI